MLSLSDKFLFRLIVGVSIFVTLVVIILNKKVIPVTIDTPDFVSFLPTFNAIVNGACSVLLVISLYFIKQKNVVMHKRLNLTAFVLSSMFLVSYIIYHYFAPETIYGDINHDGVRDASEAIAVGNIRYVYYVILITHIILAAGVLPLILFSFQRGLSMQVERHRKLVRYSFPIWLYVTVTGVIVYLMIAPYYNF